MNNISPNRNGFRRPLRFELMESRQLMASDLCQHNLTMPNDVDGDQLVSPIDALAIINQLNGSKSSESTASAVSQLYLDVNDDGFVSPIDVLSVINTLNQKSSSSESSTQSAAVESETEASSNVSSDASTTDTTVTPDIDCDTTEIGSTTVLVATIAGTTGGSGTATFKTTKQDSTTENELEVIGKGLTPDSKLDVVVAGVTVGQLPTDASGNGTLKLATTPDSADETAIPSDFPTVDTTTTIKIGTDATGTFAVPTTPDTPPSVPRHHHGRGHHGHQGHHQESNETELRVTLQGTGTQSARIKYETETDDGITFTKLIVSVANLTPSTTLDVVIDGVTVGQITTDANGAGRLHLSSFPKRANELPLPADFPAITSSSTIAIGAELSGTFADTTKPAPTVPTQPASKTTTPVASVTNRNEDGRERRVGQHRGMRFR